MATPPPTETPAPLSEEMFEVAVMLAEMGAALTQTGQSNESTALIFKASVALKAGSATIASLTERVAALTAEVKGWRDAAYLSACESDSGIGMDELREQNAALAAELAQAREALR